MATIPDALMYREVEVDAIWDVALIRASQIAAYEAKGWILLLSAVAVRESDIASTYMADMQRFNPPRRG